MNAFQLVLILHNLTFRLVWLFPLLTVTGILRRCDETGTCHPKTSSSLENIMHTKMKDYRNLSQLRSDMDGEDWLQGGQCESICSLPTQRELTRHEVSFTSLPSTTTESLHSSVTSLSCSTSQLDDAATTTDAATTDAESGIFELEM
jgi:hypothetical protein